MTDTITSPIACPDGLELELDGGIATLWLNRPSKRNALTHAMWLGLDAICRALATDPTVRLLVIRGRGEHFCAGADISALHGPEVGYRDSVDAAEEALASFPKPTIAVVTGSCVGGGTEIAIACDMRLADTTARFGITPARLGIVYPAPATARAVQLIGPSATKHLLFSAEIIDADRAQRIGLLDELHPPSELQTRVAELCQTLVARRSLLTQMASKAVVNAATTAASIQAATTAHSAWAETIANSRDATEGVNAFLERREPSFAWAPDETYPEQAHHHHQNDAPHASGLRQA